MTDATRAPEGNDAPTEAATAPSASASPDDKVKAFNRRAYGLATSRGFGNAMGRGFDLAVTLLVMVGIGWLVDNAFDTRPLFTIVFSVVGFAGTFVKLWIGYDLEMRKEEDGAIWNRKPEAKA